MQLKRIGVGVALLGLAFGGGALAASAQTANDSECRETRVAGQSAEKNITAYNACRFDKLDAAVKDLGATTPAPSPSATPTVKPSPTPAPTKTAASPTPSPTATTQPAVGTCTNPSTTFTGEGSKGVGNGYDISAEQWGVKAGYKSTLRFCSKDSWNVDIYAVDNDGQHAVQSYPSIRKIFHDWSTQDFSKDPRLSSFPKLTADFAGSDPGNCSGCIYETAFDNWINGIGNGASTEQMIWLHNVGQRPYGNKVASGIQISGHTWDLWTGNSNHYVAFVPTDTSNIAAGNIDVKAFIQYQVDHNLIGANPALPGAQTDPYIGQISYGVEPVATAGKTLRFDFTKFNVNES